MLSPQAIAVEGLGFVPMLIAVRGLQPAEESASVSVGTTVVRILSRAATYLSLSLHVGASMGFEWRPGTVAYVARDVTCETVVSGDTATDVRIVAERVKVEKQTRPTVVKCAGTPRTNVECSAEQACAVAVIAAARVAVAISAEPSVSLAITGEPHVRSPSV